MTAPSGIAINRIETLVLNDFRGFTGEHRIDVDADLVLITAPNGYGKSSLLEAITLLLTGWYWPYGSNGAVGDADLRSRYATRGVGFRLEAAVRGYAHPVSLEPANGGIPLPTWGEGNDLDHRFRLIRDANRYEDRELPARLTAFFQDRIDKLFDEAVQGNTLRDMYEPLPAGVDVLLTENRTGVLCNTPEDALSKAKQLLQQPPPDAEDKAKADLNATLVMAYRGLRQPYLELAAMAKDWPGAAETPVTIEDDGTLDPWAAKVRKAAGYPEGGDRSDLRKDFAAALTAEIERQIGDAKKRALGASEDAAGIREELEKVKTRIAEIDHQYPDLAREVRAFAASDPGQPDAAQLFRTLADNAPRWSRVKVPADAPAGEERFQRALAELAAVDADQARQCAQAIEDWLVPRRQAFTLWQRLDKEHVELEERLRRAVASVEVAELEARQKALSGALRELRDPWTRRHALRAWEDREPQRREALASIVAAQRAVIWCRERILEIARPGPNCELMCAVQGLANTVLRRFSLVDGILPLRLAADEQRIAIPSADTDAPPQTRRVYQVLTADGRELRHLSTGQRAQIAVSFLTSQNLAVPQYLNHRVLVLDDVTTAYDLSNLTREAVLWRQLAYADDQDQRKRQVFISSHHEDMTNQLLDLLVPPAGKKMRLLRFTGWTREKGPTIEQFDVTATRAAGTSTQPGAGRAALARDLEAF